MILDSPDVPAERLERETGWVVESEGACRGGVCVPLGPRSPGLTVDLLSGRALEAFTDWATEV